MPLVQDIQLNCFNYLLPPYVSKLNNHEDESREANKKEKFESERNMKLNSDWNKLHQSESWDTIFMNKTNNSPFLSMGCRACLKFHVKGICYTDCRHKNSHIEFNNEDSTKLINHIKMLQGEWFCRQRLSSVLPRKRVPPDKLHIMSSLIDPVPQHYNNISTVFEEKVTKEKTPESTKSLLLPSNLDAKVSATNLKAEVLGKHRGDIDVSSIK